MGETRPYKTIGLRLRRLREKANRSLFEVSGAIEIDALKLERIEAGHELPDEDILMLLMDHFGVSENETVKLWELAGYDKDQDKAGRPDEQLFKQIMMVLPFDNKVAYINQADVQADKNGVVIGFELDDGKNRQSVAKVGMSVEMAKDLAVLIAEQLHSLNHKKAIQLLPSNVVPNKTDKKK